jgi:hypothetical protein
MGKNVILNGDLLENYGNSEAECLVNEKVITVKLAYASEIELGNATVYNWNISKDLEVTTWVIPKSTKRLNTIKLKGKEIFTNLTATGGVFEVGMALGMTWNEINNLYKKGIGRKDGQKASTPKVSKTTKGAL